MTYQNFDQITALGQNTVAAFVQSGAMVAEGFQALANAYSGFANRSWQRTTVAVMAMSAVKTPAEFQLVSSVIARTNLETVALESRKLQDLAKSVVVCSFAPLTNHVGQVSGLLQAA